MADPRHTRLAETLVGYSCALEPGHKVLIEGIDVPVPFLVELIRVAAEAGAAPLVSLKSQPVWRALLLAASEEQLAVAAAAEAERMSRVDAYIGIRGSDNVAEWADVPPEKIELYERLVLKPVHLDIRVPRTRWVVLRWPNASMAQLAQTSTEAFEEFFFAVCTIDYRRMGQAMRPLKELMEATDRVRLVAPDTDLEFSIHGVPAVCCDGRRNIPDGEVFTAPVRDSVEGTIRYNTPSLHHGLLHEDVRLRFERGRIVEASSSRGDDLRRVLDTDEGSRYVGEFSIAFHPLIRQPMFDILFDEKIAGSIHLTPGQAYQEADNGNRSTIHWDLVLRMDEAAGGGEIYFDGRLVRRDGRFVAPELEGLNPERLLHKG